jgi:outer membrane immunogenic protein
VEVGCNYQASTFVVGLEGDFNGSSLRETANYVTPNGPGAFFASTDTETKKLDWFSTIRARVGFTPSDRVLIFATGGFVVADVSSTFGLLFTDTSSFTGSASATRTGWTVGGGFEWALVQNWSVKAEYLYIDLGTWGYASPNTAGPGGGPVTPAFTWANNIRLQEQVVRVGLNYKFDWANPVVARY